MRAPRGLLTDDAAARRGGAPIVRRARPYDPLRLAMQSALLIAAIIAVTFAVLVLLDVFGIHIEPTADMLTAG